MVGRLQVVLAQLGGVVETNGAELAVFSLIAIASLAGLVIGGLKLQDAYAIWSNDPIPAGELHLAETETEVEGTAEPIDEPTMSPYTDTPCVAYEFKKEHRETRRDEDGNREQHWETVASGSDSVPFLVTDDTGQAAVDPDGATLEAGTDHKTRAGDIRKTERRIEPDDSVHVYGQKHEASEAGGQLGEHRQYIGDGGQVTTFQITQGGELYAVGWTAGKAVLYTLASLLVGVFATDQLLGLFGIGPFLLS